MCLRLRRRRCFRQQSLALHSGQCDQLRRRKRYILIHRRHRADALSRLQGRIQRLRAVIGKAHRNILRLAALRKHHGRVCIRVDNDVRTSLRICDGGLTEHLRVGKHLHIIVILEAVFHQALRLDKAHIQLAAVLLDQRFTAADHA